ncbi:PIN domain-containing protein [Archangium gephyra]|uniref:PIN domain-containing protein n=1 Tax=Archangium gephyra TaxID=48 RepID=UPI0035D44DE9
MARVFIDTNIYLEFFKTSDPSLLKHAKAISHEISGEVFVSQQMVDEVERNKMAVASRFLEEQLKRLDLPKVFLPVFPDNINQKIEALSKEASKIRQEGNALVHDYLSKLAQSSDETSTILASLFSGAKKPNEDELKRARDRRERGNPPGKREDPLGDQISWEQFLGQAKESPIWIVTKDLDYLFKFEGRVQINSYLRQELIAARPGVDIRVFESISAFLKDFELQKRKETSETTPSIITPEDSVQAELVEQIIDEIASDDWDDDRTVCENCDPGEDRMVALVDYTHKQIPPSPDNPDSLYDEGTCSWCNGITIRCRSCGADTPVAEYQYGETIECNGACGFAFVIESSSDGDGIYSTSIEVVTPPSE